MSNEPVREFLEKIEPDDLERLARLLATLRRVDGWCRVNRAIGKFVIVTVIGLLILLSQGLDAIRNLFSWFKH